MMMLKGLWPISAVGGIAGLFEAEKKSPGGEAGAKGIQRICRAQKLRGEFSYGNGPSLKSIECDIFATRSEMTGHSIKIRTNCFLVHGESTKSRARPSRSGDQIELLCWYPDRHTVRRIIRCGEYHAFFLGCCKANFVTDLDAHAALRQLVLGA
jgi:hypothetical protein